MDANNVRRAEVETDLPEGGAPRQQRRQRSKGDLWKFLTGYLAAAVEDPAMKKNDVRVGVMLAIHGQFPQGAEAYLNTGRLECWPAIDTIARRLEISRSTVKASIRHLAAAGLVGKTVRRGRDLTNIYQMLIPERLKIGTDKTGENESENGRERKQKTINSRPQYPSLREGNNGKRGSSRGAAPSRDAGAPRRRARGMDGPDLGDDLSDYFATVASAPIPEDDDGVRPSVRFRPEAARVRRTEYRTDGRRRPSKTRTPTDDFEAYCAGLDPDDEERDRYDWIADQLADLPPTEGLALIERNSRGLTPGERSFLRRRAEKGTK